MNYSTFVGKEVVEMTRKLLPLSHKREDTYLAGVSMGGYGTLLNGMRYADTFGRIAAMSPAIDTYEVHENQPDAGFSIELLDNIFGSREEFLAGDTNLTKTRDLQRNCRRQVCPSFTRKATETMKQTFGKEKWMQYFPF